MVVTRVLPKIHLAGWQLPLLLLQEAQKINGTIIFCLFAIWHFIKSTIVSVIHEKLSFRGW